MRVVRGWWEVGGWVGGGGRLVGGWWVGGGVGGGGKVVGGW